MAGRIHVAEVHDSVGCEGLNRRWRRLGETRALPERDGLEAPERRKHGRIDHGRPAGLQIDQNPDAESAGKNFGAAPEDVFAAHPGRAARAQPGVERESVRVADRPQILDLGIADVPGAAELGPALGREVGRR
ncbi:MAG TPA: hypothetical protein PK954_18095 [Anaerolineales bacterium]|nr:hypothetical protein [Anaerolineales bacterium]